MSDTVTTIDDTELYPVDVSLPSSDLVYGLINHDNPPQNGEHVLTPELLVLGTPTTNQSAYERDTQITATATAKLTELDDYEGSTTLYYDRINIGAYLRNVAPILIDAPDATKMRDIWPIIKERFGLGLTAEEIVNDELNWDTVNGQLLRVASNCLAWTGSVRILMKSRVPNLDDIIAIKELDGLKFFGQGVRASGEIYSYSRDTSDYGELLASLVTGTVISDVVVADLLAEMTTDRWVLDDNAAPYNLYNAKVDFNGELGERIPARAGYQYGIEISLDENYCTAVGGPLIFYYNVDGHTASLQGRSPEEQG